MIKKQDISRFPIHEVFPAPDDLMLHDKFSPNAEEQDDGFVAGDKRPLIPEGTYNVSCVRIEKGIAHFRSLKLFVHFKIVDPGEFMGTELFMSVNLINSRTGKPFRKVPPGSKYYSQWVIANKNRQPSRNDRMSHKIFLNGIFEAVVRTVKPKFPDVFFARHFSRKLQIIFP